FVVSRPEITKCGHGVRKQVVDDGQHRVAGGDDGFLLATASGQAPVTGAQEGVGTRIGEGDAPEGACEPWVSPTAALTRKSDGEWAAEGTRRSRVMWYCCGFGIMRRHR